MTRLIAGLDFHNQELTVGQCVLQSQQLQKGLGVFSVSLKMNDATQRIFQKFFVLNFSQLVKAPLSWSVKHVLQEFVVFVLFTEPGFGAKIPLTQ